MPTTRSIFMRHLRVFLLCLCLALPSISSAGVGDCLKSALSTVNPADLARAAKFASQHPSCLADFVPPTLVPYTALSSSVDAANQSGILNKVGLGFGDNYKQCIANLDPGSHALKLLAPVLKPVCNNLNMDCNAFEGQAADQVNQQITQQVPLLSLMPCSCAAATSGLGVQKLVELVKVTESCGAPIAEAAQLLYDASKGVYKTGEAIVNLGESGLETTGAVVNEFVGILKSFGCSVAKLFGGCSSPKQTGLGVANKFCASRGGLAAFSSKSNDPNEFSLQCNDQTKCVAKPGQPVMCMSGEKVKAAEAKAAQQQAQQKATNEAYCKGRTETLQGIYGAKCRDGACKALEVLVLASLRADCISINNDGPKGFPPGTFPPSDAVAWMKTHEPEIVTKLDALVNESILRDPKATGFERMGAQGCQLFLGRQDEFLCPTQGGYDDCVKLAKKGQIKVCYSTTGATFKAPAVAITNLQGLGAVTSSLPPSTAPSAVSLPPSGVKGTSAIGQAPATGTMVPPSSAPVPPKVPMNVVAPSSASAARVKSQPLH